MFIDARLGLFLLLPLLSTTAVSAQQSSPRSRPGGEPIYLDVVVTPKSGAPVSGLQEQDFTLIDNKLPQTIKSFQALGGSQAPLEVVLVVDAVNSDFTRVGQERGEIEKFLHANGGHLAFPTTLAFFTDNGTQIRESFSSDGNALSAELEQYALGLRNIRRSSGVYGAAERFQLSIQALEMLTTREAPRPGRKVILWASPGWPLLSGPGTVETIDSKQQQQLFTTIVNLSTQLEQGRITLYSIDPLGAGESELRASYYKEFVKGIREPNRALPGNLALQVLVTQTGGLALDFNNNVVEMLQRCLTDTQAYYEISFDPPAADQRDEYHHLEIKLAKPGLTARTRQGYYAQPLPH